MGVTRASIYCRRCSYVLDGLDGERCPECGNAYDPTDRATYETMPRWARWRRRLLRCGLALIVLGMLGAIAFEACRIPPSLRVVEIVPRSDSGWTQVRLVLSNRSLRPVSYSGDATRTPLYMIRYWRPGGKKYTSITGTWFGTGLRSLALRPGQSITFSASVYRYDDPPPYQIQVGLSLPSGTVWSETFALGGGVRRDEMTATAGGMASEIAQ